MSNVMECEVCDEVKECTLHYGNVMYCESCWTLELESQKIHMSPEAQQARMDDYNERVRLQESSRVGNDAIIPINSVLRQANDIHSSLQVKTDLFNAETVAIVEIKKAIDEDSAISNKPYALAEILKSQFDKNKALIFDLNQQTIEANNKQKAIQVYLNNLANTLRIEERERLKIADINYKPAAPKVSKPRTAFKNKPAKLDKVLLRKLAAEVGCTEFTLQSVVVAKGITVEAAAEMVKKSIELSKLG